MAVRYVKEVGVADIQTEQPAEQDAGLHGVLALYAPLLAGLRRAAPVDRQVSLLVDEAVGVWNRPGFDTFLSEASLRFSPFDYQLQAARSALPPGRGGCGTARGSTRSFPRRRSGSARLTTSCRRHAARCGGCGAGRSSPTRSGSARPSRPA